MSTSYLFAVNPLDAKCFAIRFPKSYPGWKYFYVVRTRGLNLRIRGRLVQRVPIKGVCFTSLTRSLRSSGMTTSVDMSTLVSMCASFVDHASKKTTVEEVERSRVVALRDSLALYLSAGMGASVLELNVLSYGGCPGECVLSISSSEDSARSLCIRSSDPNREMAPPQVTTLYPRQVEQLSRRLNEFLGSCCHE